MIVQKLINLGNEDTLSDEALKADVATEAKTAVFYAFLVKNNHPERIVKAPKRLLQHVGYTTIMEDRMLNMEKPLEQLEKPEAVEFGNNTHADGAKSEDLVGKEQRYTVILGISRMSFEEYKPKPSDVEVSGDVMYKMQHSGIEAIPKSS